MDKITTFLKSQEHTIKSNDYDEFFLTAYHNLNTDQVKYLDQVIFPKALSHKPIEEREELSKKIITGKLSAIDYILMREVEGWKEDEGAEEMSTGAFIESHIHNFLGMGTQFWKTRLKAQKEDLDVEIRPDSYGIEIIKAKD